MTTGPGMTLNKFIHACLWGDVELLKEVDIESFIIQYPQVLSVAHLDLFDTLLAFDIVRQHAAGEHNLVLRRVAEYGSSIRVAQLLKIDEVRQVAAVNDNDVLRWTMHNALPSNVKPISILRPADHDYYGVVCQLLEIDSVRANAAADNNSPLRAAFWKKRYDIAERLLNEPVVWNYLLKKQQDLVIQQKEFFKNFALRNLKEGSNLEFVKRLLEVPVIWKDLLENDIDSMSGKQEFIDIRKRYHQCKLISLFLFKKFIPDNGDLRKMLHQTVFHDYEHKDSECLKTIPGGKSNAVRICPILFSSKHKIAKSSAGSIQDLDQDFKQLRFGL